MPRSASKSLSMALYACMPWVSKMESSRPRIVTARTHTGRLAEVEGWLAGIDKVSKRSLAAAYSLVAGLLAVGEERSDAER